MRFNIKRCLIILLACIFIPLSILSAGYSNWYVLQQSSKTAQGNKINGDTLDSIIDADTVNNAYGNVMRTVNFYYWSRVEQSSKTTDEGTPTTSSASTSKFLGTPADPELSITINGTPYNKTATEWKTIYNSNNKAFSPLILTDSNKDNETGILTETYQQAFVSNASTSTTSNWGTYTTTLTVTYRIATIVKTFAAGLLGTPTIYHSTKVISGNTITPPELSYDNKSLIGFYESISSAPGKVFDFSTPITKDTAIIVQWADKPTNGNYTAENSLTTAINNYSSTAESLLVYNGGTYDIASDFSYSATSFSVDLGINDKENTAVTKITTIAENVVIDFCMNNGKTNIDAANDGTTISDVTASKPSGDNFISLDWKGTSTATTQDTRDYTVRLQNDLIVNGTLNLGGHTGSTNYFEGYIIGSYVKLDLNGHNIIINSTGTLHSYGYITDSVGTGKITVNPGGKLYSQIVIYDLKGGNNTLWAYGKGLSPFENYTFAYLDADVEFIANESGTGEMHAFTKLNMGELGFTKFYMPFIGKGNSFLLNIEGTDGSINYTPKEISVLKGKLNYINYNLVYRRNCFDFNDVNVTFQGISIPVNVYVNIEKSGITAIVDDIYYLYLDKYAFPLSSTFDMNFYSSTFTLSQKINLQPGSSFIFDKNSSLILDYYKDNNGLRTVNEITVNATGKMGILSIPVTATHLPGWSDYLSGGLFAYSVPPADRAQYNGALYGMVTTSYADYWTYFEKATINIYGTVVFTQGNHAPYTLAGNIYANKFSTSTNTQQNYSWTTDNLKNQNINLQTYDLQIYISKGFWFNGNSLALTWDNLKAGNIVTSENAYINVSRFYAEPMINNGVAYIYDGYSDTANQLIGKYNNDTGIFTSGTSNYFFYTDPNLLTTTTEENKSTTTSTAQEFSIDYTIIPTLCTVNTATHSITSADNKNYVYFGGIYLEASSVSASAAVVNASKFSSRTGYDLSASNMTYNSNGYWVQNSWLNVN